MPAKYRVRQTDCRTGWQVIGPNGRPLATYRRREPADEYAASLNRPTTDPGYDRDLFGSSPQFLSRP